MVSEALARGLIRLLVTAGILAAVYFFIVKPVLNETSNQLDRAFDASDSITKEIQDSFNNAGISGSDPGRASASQADKLLKCVQRVQPDTTRMQRCAQRYAA